MNRMKWIVLSLAAMIIIAGCIPVSEKSDTDKIEGFNADARRWSAETGLPLIRVETENEGNTIEVLLPMSAYIRNANPENTYTVSMSEDAAGGVKIRMDGRMEVEKNDGCEIGDGFIIFSAGCTVTGKKPDLVYAKVILIDSTPSEGPDEKTGWELWETFTDGTATWSGGFVVDPVVQDIESYSIIVTWGGQTQQKEGRGDIPDFTFQDGEDTCTVSFWFWNDDLWVRPEYR